MLILAIDPGPKKGGVVLWDSEAQAVVSADVAPNTELLDVVSAVPADVFAFEMIASYGMAVGRDTFETLVWSGRLVQRWTDMPCIAPRPVLRVYRQDAKRCVLRTHKGSDSDVRSALIDRIGHVGTRKNPGPLYGVTSHAWAALAVAVTAQDILDRPESWPQDQWLVASPKL